MNEEWRKMAKEIITQPSLGEWTVVVTVLIVDIVLLAWFVWLKITCDPIQIVGGGFRCR